MYKFRGSQDMRSSFLTTLCRRLFFHGREPQQPLWKDKYAEEPEYPEILDLSFREQKKRESARWHQQIQNAATVEEKLIKINMPRYYGYKVVDLGDARLPYNCLPAMQHYTRTIFTETNVNAYLLNETALGQKNTDSLSKKEPTEVDQKKTHGLVQAVKSEIKDSLEHINDFFRNKYGSVGLEAMDCDRNLSQLIVEQVNRSCINALSADYSHLKEVEVDYNPRHEAFWLVGGIEPPNDVVKSKEGHNWQKEMANDPVDRLMQYVAQPYLTIRHRHQLPTWSSLGEVNDLKSLSFSTNNRDPRSLGYTTSYRHGANIPGFWPGSPSGFGCISFHSRSHMNTRSASYGQVDFKEVLHAQGILSSFSWLLAQANYYGFNTVSELTHPFNTQTIITNGRNWSFYEYQLNTLFIHSHHVTENPKVNYCRGTPELQLYQEFDASGKCIGFNEDVLMPLVRFYTNVPSAVLPPVELTQYLHHPKAQRIADYEDDEKRSFLQKTFKHITSNRPCHLAIPEIYLWEKIYKIDNKTRSLESKRRFFELKVNPWKRTLDERSKKYISRAIRLGSPKSKNKYRQSYYP